ncbi:unnamed protein product [Arctia plantaginis]|uniref:FAM234A/B beta-propeller domain-containing protein n=1 Tax=Arctia plantaginis TaxID=874455 RepID=A0A8S0YXI4_ARCPL|nr:unnamed protein product [Arctia plantaginis]
MSANGNGGDYAPLKQILSDSESEDEHKVENAHIKGADSCNNLDFNSGLQSSKNYSISDMDEFNTNVNTVESTMDNVSFLQSDMSNKMSFSRRCAFIVSILVCVFTVVIFLWGIPCSEIGSCTSEFFDRTMSWEHPYSEMELSGTVQVVDGAIPNIKNLIFIYRGNHMRQQTERSYDNINGVILIVGNTGKVGWFTKESRIPTDINCHLIDVNRDKQKDCIVSGTDGLLAALDSVSGTYYWHIHKQGKVFNIALIDFPVLIKDMNDDKVSELLSVATVYPSTNHNTLIIVSGATGNIMAEPIPIEDCTSVEQLSVSDTITYICRNDITKAVRSISYSVLKKLLKREQPIPRIQSPPTPKKLNISMKKNAERTRETFVNGRGKLEVVNVGECPKTCRVYLTLMLEKNGTTNVTWEYTGYNIYAMRPSSFAFANSIRGPKNINDMFYRSNIDVASISAFIKYPNFTVHDISERIVLVVFDKQMSYSINISQTDMVQICVRGPIESQTPVPQCQPDLDYQEKSMTIADLDGDSSHEVISYYSTFVAPEQYSPKNPSLDNWKLTSLVRVIRLESQLPNLFINV